MKSLIPYLVFPGTCKQAMEFYAKVLDGEITFMKPFSESPIPVPKEFKDRIFNSELKSGNIHIKASDDLPNNEVKHGTNISLFLVFSKEDEKKEVFDKLSLDGKILFPIEDNFGMLKDKYGVQWMLVNE